MNTTYWKDKKILLTGGTSGLGLALFDRLSENGAQVVSVSRHLPAKATGDHIQADVSDKRQIHRIYAEALSRLGRVDILINNASSLGPTPLRLLLDTDCEALTQTLETNVLGPFRLTKLVVGGMLLAQSGVIINISSDAAVNAYPTWGAYGISKAALDHLTQVFHAELKHENIHFLALDPGDMDTPMHLAAVPDANRELLHRPEDSARIIMDQIANEQFLPTRRSIR